MEGNQYKTIHNNNGFTLVELIVSISLTILVAWIAYGFLGTSGNFFSMNSDKADAQAQSRLIFQGMKIELGVAKQIDISNSVSLMNSGQVGYYVKSDNIFYMKEYDKAEAPAFGSLPVKNLEIHYVPVSTNVLKLIITANDGIQFETEIFSENIKEYNTKMTSGTAIIISP